MEIFDIGFVRSNENEKKDAEWGKNEAEFVIHDTYKDGLKGLSDFSHVIVLYYLDKANFQIENHLQRRPQNREDMPKVGIFSQRCKDRPNQIGVTSVKLLKVTDTSVFVQGLDAIDGTPVIDIKPYYPQYDSKSNATVPEWVNKLMENYF